MSEPSNDATDELEGLSDGSVVPPPAPERSGWKIVWFIVGLGLGVVTIARILDILAASIVGSAALALHFGEPYTQLPADVRSGLENRVEAIEPANFAQLTNIQRSDWTGQQVSGGLVRLDDATLTRRYRIVAGAIGQMPVTACGVLLRGSAYGVATGDPTGDAYQSARATFLFAIDVDRRREFVEIVVQAMEAQAHNVPVPRTVTTDQSDRIFDAMGNLATPEELSAVQAWNGDRSQTDAVVCAGVRAYQAVAMRLPVADLAAIARFDVQP